MMKLLYFVAVGVLIPLHVYAQSPPPDVLFEEPLDFDVLPEEIRIMAERSVVGTTSPSMPDAGKSSNLQAADPAQNTWDPYFCAAIESFEMSVAMAAAAVSNSPQLKIAGTVAGALQIREVYKCFNPSDNSIGGGQKSKEASAGRNQSRRDDPPDGPRAGESSKGGYSSPQPVGKTVIVNIGVKEGDSSDTSGGNNSQEGSSGSGSTSSGKDAKGSEGASSQGSSGGSGQSSNGSRSGGRRDPKP